MRMRHEPIWSTWLDQLLRCLNPHGLQNERNWTPLTRQKRPRLLNVRSLKKQPPTAAEFLVLANPPAKRFSSLTHGQWVHSLPLRHL